MTTDHQKLRDAGWLEASGLLHIFRTLGLAVQPAKLGMAVCGIIVTFLFGWLLDAMWTARGGVDDGAITQFVVARELDRSYTEPSGDRGIFEVWRNHERQCVLGLLGSSVPGVSVAAGTPLGTYMESHSRAQPLRNLAGMIYGIWWLVAQHTVYAICFGIGMLLIWSFVGGAVCRMAAVQFARDEKLTLREGARFSWEKLFGGFVLAPCIPVIFILITAVVMVLGGALLRVPYLGDLIGGILFPLAILGGFIIAGLTVGLAVGGSLFWPAVASEGSDAFDAFSRGISYPVSKPWKAVWYGVIALLFAAVCWVFVNLFTFLLLTVTRGVVAFGTSPFGWWGRGEEGLEVSKLKLLWPMSGPNALYAWPDWSRLTVAEHFSGFMIGVYVLLVIGLMWAFLASFYFCASTVVYFLLRRDVDGADIDEVYAEDDGDLEAGRAAPASQASAGATAVLTSPIQKTTPAISNSSPAETGSEGSSGAPRPPTPDESADL